ncbi:hypothetical protein VitviT2T_030228 [Vitis vinifera]|uniref:Uncharacterized protein n=1 Tax=Vitis vinifera TaxID=29760 RepID=A0ABY9DZX6_VITVI|nr:hypothetical protein VitviT2T_030228 [Vitis vinifera]
MMRVASASYSIESSKAFFKMQFLHLENAFQRIVWFIGTPPSGVETCDFILNIITIGYLNLDMATIRHKMKEHVPATCSQDKPLKSRWLGKFFISIFGRLSDEKQQTIKDMGFKGLLYFACRDYIMSYVNGSFQTITLHTIG